VQQCLIFHLVMIQDNDWSTHHIWFELFPEQYVPLEYVFYILHQDMRRKLSCCELHKISYYSGPCESLYITQGRTHGVHPAPYQNPPESPYRYVTKTQLSKAVLHNHDYIFVSSFIPSCTDRNTYWYHRRCNKTSSHWSIGDHETEK
jgi:hypothetical protein